MRSTPKGQWRLRWRLAVFFVLLFGFIFALSAFSHFQKVGDQKDSRVEAMQQVQRTSAAVINGFVRDLESFSLSTAITLGESDLDIDLETLTPEREAGVNDYLSKLHESYGILRAIFVTDPQGRIVFSQEGASKGVDVSERSYVLALINGADTSWSDGFSGLETGRLLIAHSRRIVNPAGETSGFLVVALYPESLVERLTPRIAGDGHVSLFDGQGQLLLQVPVADENDSLDGGITAWPELAAAQSGEEVVLRSTDVPLAPRDRYVALGGLSRVDWAVAYSLPSSEIEGAANAIFERDLILLGALMALGLASVLFLSARVSDPIAQLGRASVALGNGEKADFSAVKTSEADLSLLAATMQRMAEAYQAREDRLSQDAAIIDAIERAGESLAGELDLERTVREIIDSGLRLTGAESVFFFYPSSDEMHHSQGSQFGIPQVTLSPDSPAVQEVLRGEALHIVDVETRYGAAADTPPEMFRYRQARSLIGTPIRSRAGAVIGALFLAHSARGALAVADLRVTRGLARWAGIVLENAELFKQSHEVQELLRQANDDKDEFLAMISHELRTPITTIYGGSRILRLRQSKLSEDAVQDMINSVAEEAETLYHLVEDLLAIARTEASKHVEREPVSLGQALKQTVAQYRRTHSREINLRVAEDLPPVLADVTYLSQVVGNLISNADKYSPAGLSIEIEATQEGDWGVLRVSDHGPGVRDGEIEKIFERFFRSPDSSDRKISGKGLGLTVCRRLIEAMQGSIRARNIPEGGLEVACSLELAVEAGEDADQDLRREVLEAVD